MALPVPHRCPRRVDSVVPTTAPIPEHPITKPNPKAPKPRSFRITVGKTAPRMTEPMNHMWVIHAKGARWEWP